MRLLNTVCRILLGSLFIFSGFIKLNDPYGTAYKLHEYFEVFAADGFPFFLKLSDHALFFSILISGAEVVIGAAILMAYRMRITLWTTLLLILFFTFLTYYSYAYEKVRECGCFGAAIKFTPLQSFLKDLFLLVLILTLFFYRKKNESAYNGLKGHILISLTAIIAFGAGIYSIYHLPFFDPTPYAEGNNLNVLTRPKASPKYEWVLEKDGKEYTFDDEHYPSDTTYKYKRHTLLTDSSLIVPEINGYRIYNDEGDFTRESLTGKKIFIVIANPGEAWKNCDAKCMERVNNFTRFAERQGFKTMILTVPAEGNTFEEYRMDVQLRGDYYYMDDTILKTMIRSNPGVILLKDGVIIKKWHYRTVPDPESMISLMK